MSAIAPCCGQPRDYCECPQFKQDRAVLLALARQECPPTPKLPPGTEYDDPPF
ncbi:hypothetical protein J4U01_gp086 [Mycobacterium phage Kumao]|uniref:Uncharacterized protein n=1 Tax=Mycobacterium phage Kumao TaxID=2041344 RepID=A0A2D1GPV6_9CAUD|nr:hypothetical protein J4U01_gp086 [Mycobacterium phage Kumao]ATN94072.1 hypothetical protein SEA_KUMAO_110 [Mycobacterium phage Kumao]